MIGVEVNKVYVMNCIEGMNKIIEPGSIDIIVTSPPYNIGIKYNTYVDKKPFKEYLKWMEEFGKACSRVLKDNGSLFFNIGDKPSEEFKSFIVAKRISKYLKLQNTIHWIKSLAIPEYNFILGCYKPLTTSKYLTNFHEFIFHFTKNKNVALDILAIGVPRGGVANIELWKRGKFNDLRDRGNVWFIPYEIVTSEKEHPALFPEKLPEMCIKLHGFNKDTIVLDPFLGSGTTCVVAKKLGCKWIGFEIDPKYAKIAQNKLSQTTLSYII